MNNNTVEEQRELGSGNSSKEVENESGIDKDKSFNSQYILKEAKNILVNFTKTLQTDFTNELSRAFGNLREKQELEALLKDKNQELDKIQGNYNEVKEELAQVNQKLVAISEKLTQEHQKLSESENNRAQTKAILDRTIKKLTETEDECNKVKTNFKETSQNLDETRDKLVEQENNYARTQASLDHTIKKLTETEHEYNKVKANFAEASQKLAETREKLLEQENKNTQTEASLNRNIEKLRETEHECNKVKTNFKETSQKLTETEQQYNEKMMELDQRTCQLAATEKEKENLLKEMSRLQTLFSTIDALYKQYRELNKGLKSKLNGLLKDDSLHAFIGGIQAETMDSLWDYIKDELVHSRDEVRELIPVYDGLFSIFSAYKTDYTRQEVEAGNPFDTDKFTANSPLRGKVEEVLFQGYKFKDKVRKKSLVLCGR